MRAADRQTHSVQAKFAFFTLLFTLHQLGLRVGSHVVLFYIHQMNSVNLTQGYHFSGFSGNVEMAGNSAKVRES